MPEFKKEDFNQKDKSGIAEYFSAKYGEPIAFGYTADIYKSGDRAIKVFSKDFGKFMVFREAYAMACVEKAGVPMAKILDVREEGGFWITESEFIEGEDLLKGVFACSMKGDAKGAQDIIRKTAKLQASFNQKTAWGLPKYKDYAEDVISASPYLDDGCKKRTIDYLHGLPEGNFIVHGDFHPQQVLMTAGGDMVILDWVEAGSAAVGCDAARTYMNYLHLPPVPPLQNPELKLAETYIEAYTQETGVSKETIEAWLPVHAAINFGEKEEWFNAGIKKYLL